MQAAKTKWKEVVGKNMSSCVYIRKVLGMTCMIDLWFWYQINQFAGKMAVKLPFIGIWQLDGWIKQQISHTHAQNYSYWKVAKPKQMSL